MSKLCLTAAIAMIVAGCAAPTAETDPCADIDPVPEGESLDIGVQELSRKARCEKRKASGAGGSE